MYWSYGSGWAGESSCNVSSILTANGSYLYRMYAFNNEASSRDISNAVAVSKDINFTYTIPGKKLSTPSKPTLFLHSENGRQWVEINWNKVEHAIDYEVHVRKESEKYGYYFDSTDNKSTETIRYEDNWYMDKGEDYYITITARSENVNEYNRSDESVKSDYICIDANGNVRISSQPGVIVPNGIGLNYDSLTLQKGETRKVTATVTPDNAVDKTVKWATGNSAIATVDQNGNVKAVAAGSTTLSATTSNGISKSIPIKVIVNPTSIKLNKTTATMYFGESLTLTPILAPSDVTEKTITWTSSNTAVATVNNGKVKANNKGGETTITAKTVNGLTATCKVTVYADNNPSNIFADIKYGSWQYNAAKAVYDKGYMTGKGNLNGRVLFSPDTNMTRSQFVVSLYSMDGKPAVTYEQRFSDVKSGDWYASAVTWAVKNGITAGNKNGTFGVDGKATREQIALMFYKYASYKGYDVSIKATTNLDGFTDASKVDSWAVEAIKWAVERGIISGKGNATDGYRIAPTSSATRIECAAMMNKFSEVYSGAPKMGDEDLEEPLALPEENIEDLPVPADETEDVIIDDKEETEDNDVPSEDEKDTDEGEINPEEESEEDSVE